MKRILSDHEIDVAREKFLAQMTADLLTGEPLTTYLESGKVNYVYTRDDLLNECEIFKKGDAAALLDNPEAFGAILYRRLKEEAAEWVEAHEDQLQNKHEFEDAA